MNYISSKKYLVSFLSVGYETGKDSLCHFGSVKYIHVDVDEILRIILVNWFSI